VLPISGVSSSGENATLAEKYLDGVKGHLVLPVFHFYDFSG
jgi:hypothetical protein